MEPLLSIAFILAVFVALSVAFGTDSRDGFSDGSLPSGLR